MATKSLIKMFMPSVEIARRIDNSDATNSACAAHFRFTARMNELSAQFEQKANELRAAYLKEIDGIRGYETADE
jgi:hypothetical protein